MTSDTPGPEEPRPRDPEPASPDPGAVTAPYTPSGGFASTTPGAAPPPPAEPTAPPAPTGGGLPPGVGWAPTVPVVQEVAPGLTFSSTSARFVAWIVDLIFLGIVFVIIATLLEAAGIRTTPTAPLGPPGTPGYWNAFSRADPLGSLLTVALSAVYFIGSWTGGRRGTPGQRLLSIQVGNAFDGRPLTMDQAIRRWLGLGEVITLLGVLPALAGLGGLLLFVWSILLLITTATSPTKQGLHDRLANSAVVRPISAGNGWVIACLIIVLALVLIPLLAIIALIFLGGQVSTILSTVGESV
ncbi:MAG TPA: RDD family protein [Candidatus Limnocylindrales bacterium]|nr:RDD family protein [Candidatus Limnocylindrales bacterium]